MLIVKYRKIFYALSLVLLALSVFAIVRYGLNLGTDFIGGTLLEVKYEEGRPELEELNSAVLDLELGSILIQPTGEQNYTLKLRNISETEKEALFEALTLGGKKAFTQERLSEVGPTLGKELRNKGVVAITLVVLLIILYIAFVFRQVSKHHVKSWKYGVAAIVALTHDIIISAGAMALLGHFSGAEADALFLTALLTILGLSVNDTIVVFDRIRENLHRHPTVKFEEVVGVSLRETYIRSINTTVVIIIVLVSLLIWGPASTYYFALILLIGMVAGTYSSIFIASNLLISWEKFGQR
ncbi:MAG TPA: protein translocase subunit SecF [Candidatus Paceibacterota bacterium]|nr:protein translocase subunit SecF [Candidatus Paceibacterota bacterium]HPN89731.1 protein translocase subunit SecF [Candidatus Paceibacterota bacterium]HQF40872.1 protein translocase subunit SecF [Candidatus Paceibacterota bacterium]HQI25833.1 protein translocase subunit SecF [Candidatus Paceibacterota bacterium]HQJ83675.1 protein translocase subunit SecF [Candidatus Paceibacterota bacterium]